MVTPTDVVLHIVPKPHRLQLCRFYVEDKDDDRVTVTYKNLYEVVIDYNMVNEYTVPDNSLYSMRPDGTWYECRDILISSRIRDIRDLVEGGMEPWRAFEMVAL